MPASVIPSFLTPAFGLYSANGLLMNMLPLGSLNSPVFKNHLISPTPVCVVNLLFGLVFMCWLQIDFEIEFVKMFFLI